MIRIALPKGRLFAGVQQALANVGLAFQQPHPRTYMLASNQEKLQGKLFKPRAIAQLVALNRYQIGFVGLDLVQEADLEDVIPILDLGLNRVDLVVAIPATTPNILTDPPKRPLVIATEYMNLTDRWAFKHNLAHITIQTWGSTEGYAPEDADIIFDCCETGDTIRANGLIIVDRLVSSSTWMIANKSALEDPRQAQEILDLKKRLEEVVNG
ncbi:ATP phosphoribosyltransferase [Candidatus Uhrbacteria bacterium]|nr:ATP phosphoribosyltransferase [Candidatus Uhrbacteria bacterium]